MVFSEYLNDVFAPLGKKAGLSGRDVSIIWTPQIIASIVDIPINLLTTDLGSRIMNAILGIVSMGAVALGKVKGVAAAELEEMASYWITSIYVPSPNNTVVTNQIASLAAGIASGNTSQILSSLFTSPNSALQQLSTYTGIINPKTYTSGTNVPLMGTPSLSVFNGGSIKPAIGTASPQIAVLPQGTKIYEPAVAKQPVTNNLKMYSA